MIFPSSYIIVGIMLVPWPASPSVAKSVCMGRSLILSCHGEPIGDVEWRFMLRSDWLLVAKLHTGAFSPGPGFQGRVKSFFEEQPGNYSLVLDRVVYDDLGTYECRYKNGTFISDVELHIPVPSLVSIAMGMPAILPCYGNIDKQATRFDLDITWKRDGQDVYRLYKNAVTYGPGFENRVSVSPEEAFQGNLSLTIRPTWFSDQGHYQCFYNSPKESGNPDSARLIVTGHPLEILTVEAGDDLPIPLRTTDPVRVTFTGPGLGEVLMVDGHEGPVAYGQRCGGRCEVLGRDDTLLLSRVTLQDAGVYEVTHSETNTTISKVSVHVSGVPLSEAPMKHSGAPALQLPWGAKLAVLTAVAVGCLFVIIVCLSVFRFRRNRHKQPASRLCSEPKTDPKELSVPLSKTEPSQTFCEI